MQFQEIIIKYPISALLICMIFSYPAFKILSFVAKLIWEFIAYLLGSMIQNLIEQNMTASIRNARICSKAGMESKTLVDLFLLIEEEINKLQKRVSDLEKSNEP